MRLSKGGGHYRLSTNISFSAWLWEEIKEMQIFLHKCRKWLISDCYFAPMVLPIIKFPGKSDSFICRGYNHMNYRFHLDSSHLSQWEISFCHFHQTKITFANMNKESNMLNYTTDLYGHLRTLCLAQGCVLMEKCLVNIWFLECPFG